MSRILNLIRSIRLCTLKSNFKKLTWKRGNHFLHIKICVLKETRLGKLGFQDNWLSQRHSKIFRDLISGFLNAK